MRPGDNFGIGFLTKVLLPSYLHHSIRARMFDKHVSPTWDCGMCFYQNVASPCLYDVICPHKLAQQEAGMLDIPQVPICRERRPRSGVEGSQTEQVGEKDAGMRDMLQVPICPERRPRNAVEGTKIEQVGEDDVGMLDIPQIPTCSDLQHLDETSTSFKNGLGMLDIPQVLICPERQPRKVVDGSKIEQVGAKRNWNARHPASPHLPRTTT